MPHNNLALHLAGCGRVDEAIAEYQKALQITPRYWEAHNNLGVALKQTGRWEEAIEQFRTAADLNPTTPGVRFNLAESLMPRRRFNEAAEQFEKWAQLEPNLVEPRDRLGNALTAAGRFAEAFKVYWDGWEMDPDHPAIQADLAWLEATCPDASLRDGPHAADLAESANKGTDQRQPVVLATLAAAYAEVGRFREALATAQRALKLATEERQALVANALRARIALYKARKPSRNTSSAFSLRSEEWPQP